MYIIFSTVNVNTYHESLEIYIYDSNITIPWDIKNASVFKDFAQSQLMGEES